MLVRIITSIISLVLIGVGVHGIIFQEITAKGGGEIVGNRAIIGGVFLIIIGVFVFVAFMYLEKKEGNKKSKSDEHS